MQLLDPFLVHRFLIMHSQSEHRRSILGSLNVAQLTCFARYKIGVEAANRESSGQAEHFTTP